MTKAIHTKIIMGKPMKNPSWLAIKTPSATGIPTHAHARKETDFVRALTAKPRMPAIPSHTQNRLRISIIILNTSRFVTR